MNSGVYQIKNLMDGKLYVGSSVNFTERWTRHQRELRRNTHHNQRLQNAWNKYGETSFEFSILLQCDRERSIVHEQGAIDFLKPEYNICPTAKSLVGLSHSEATRNKLSLALRGYRHTAETRKRMAAAQLGNLNSVGHKHTDASKQKMSAAHKGNNGCLGFKHSAETLVRMSAASRGRVVSDETRAKLAVSQTRRREKERLMTTCAYPVTHKEST